MKQEFTERHKKLLAILSIIVFILLTVIVCWFVGRPMLKFVSEPERFRVWVDEHGIWGRLSYVGMVFLQVLVAIIPGEPLEIGGGYAFGALEGTILCLVGATVGSILVFLFVRRFGVLVVEAFFSKEKIQSLRFLQTSPKRDFLFLMIFMIPGTPKDLLCYVAGLTDLRFPVWLLICSLGRIPSILTSTLGGDALGGKNYLLAVIVFAVTLAISGVGLLLYQRLCRRQKHTDDAKKNA